MALLMALLLAMLGDSWGQSQPPSSRAPAAQSSQPQSTPANGNQTPHSDQRGTDKSPLIVKIQPTQESDAKTAADLKHEDEKTANDRAIALFTARLFWATVALSVIAFFQFVIFIWQGIQLRRTVGATNSSAKAAQESADALVAVERARFYVVIAGHDLNRFIQTARRHPNSEGMEMSGDVRIDYSFKNYGKTPGLIIEISHGIALSEEPPVPVYTVVRQAPIEYMVAGSSSTEKHACEAQLAINSVGAAKLVETGRKRIWFYGRFDYRDVITGEHQVHRFYFRYIRTDTGQFRFQSFDHEHYNHST
jgi:hypothetical protein